ncbi:hypothetical protein FRC01_009458, partial [Tulasnella sp. 417]
MIPKIHHHPKLGGFHIALIQTLCCSLVSDVDDLLSHVKGLFRLIDAGASLGATSPTYTSTTISQESLGNFINTIAPGAYSHTKRIDLERLNRESCLRIVGIYGNKSEIVRLFETCGAINNEGSNLLLAPPSASRTAELRPGIYVFDPPKAPSKQTNIISATPVRYVIYWPQELVWDRFGGTIKTRHERISCMRYLTSLTDQIRCLISSDHENALGLEAMQENNLIDNAHNILREALVSNQAVPEDINEKFYHSLCSGEVTQAIVTFHLLPGTAQDGSSARDNLSSPSVRRRSSIQNSTMPDLGLRLWLLEFSERPSNRLELTPVGRAHVYPLEHPIFSSWNIRWVQMLTSEKCLLIVDTPEKSVIWLFSPNFSFRHDRATYEISPLWGQECVVAVDEKTRVIAFVIMGSWYDDKVPKITHAVFFAGTSDLCLVESSGRMRVVSVSHQRIRIVYLNGDPLFVRFCSRSDALIILEGNEAAPKALRVFHRGSFDTQIAGIVRPVPGTFLGATSFSVLDSSEPGSVFLLGLKPEFQELVFTVVDVGKEKTDSGLRARAEGDQSRLKPMSETLAATTPLISCFSEVWERFPV